jgi:uncharacterized protein YigE (DUF2233 family)
MLSFFPCSCTQTPHSSINHQPIPSTNLTNLTKDKIPPQSLPPLQGTATKSSDQPPSSITPPIPLATQKKAPLAYYHTSRNGIVLSLVSFDDRDYQLQVADQANGPATHWRDAQAATKALQGVAGINGGFFTPEGKPLGLVITQGKRRGAINTTSSLGSGIYLSNGKQSAIVRRSTYTQSPNQWKNIQELLQTGPMLAENNAPISGLSQKNNRPRSFILWDNNHHWAIGYAESCTLHDLSRALAGKAPAGFPVHTAINLDGGRSSDLWAGHNIRNGNKKHRNFLNKPVRNFLVVVPKK